MVALSLGRSPVWAVRSCESMNERTMVCGTSRCLNADSLQKGDGSTLCMNCHFCSESTAVDPKRSICGPDSGRSRVFAGDCEVVYNTE